MTDHGGEEAWRRSVESVLKGASFEETLTTITPDGSRLAPVYPRKTGTGPIEGRAPGGRWGIFQRVDHPDIDTANRLLMADLEGGADGLVIVTPDSPYARGFGVPIQSAGDLDRLLAGVDRNLISIRFDAGVRSRGIAGWLARAHSSPAFTYDAVAVFAATGTAEPEGASLTIEGRIYHEAGATPALELGAILSAGVQILRHRERHGIAVNDDAPDFTVAADQSVFTTLMKLRALRLLWQRVETLSGLLSRPIHIHAETAWRMQSRRDPATNILRNALATAAAGLGGADTITTLPYTIANGLPDAHARRIARNCQHVLLSEANLHRIADPAAGSGGLEAMTLALCETAWAQFQAIESRGGVVDVLKSGWLQAEIDRLRPQAGTLVGVNKFTLADEATVSILLPLDEGALEAKPPALRRYRDSEPFEAMP